MRPLKDPGAAPRVQGPARSASGVLRADKTGYALRAGFLPPRLVSSSLRAGFTRPDVLSIRLCRRAFLQRAVGAFHV